jgi:hypothetical protein
LCRSRSGLLGFRSARALRLRLGTLFLLAAAAARRCRLGSRSRRRPRSSHFLRCGTKHDDAIAWARSGLAVAVVVADVRLAVGEARDAPAEPPLVAVEEDRHARANPRRVRSLHYFVRGRKIGDVLTAGALVVDWFAFAVACGQGSFLLA